MKKMPVLVIRVKILSLLKIMPMNSFELSQRIGCNQEDVQEQLMYLERNGKAEKLHSEKFNEDFWKLK